MWTLWKWSDVSAYIYATILTVVIVFDNSELSSESQHHIKNASSTHFPAHLFGFVEKSKGYPEVMVVAR